jgi:hypothetical protein
MKDSKLKNENNIDIYKSRQEQIEIIEKRKTLRKVIKKCQKKKENEENSGICSYKWNNDKKDLESVLNNKIKNAEEQVPIKRKSQRDGNPDNSEEEEDEDTEKINKELQKTDVRNSLEIPMMR